MLILKPLSLALFRDITPGDCYYVSRYDDVMLVLAIDPAFKDDQPALLVLSSKSEPETALYEVLNGGGFIHDVFAKVDGCTVCPSVRIEDVCVAAGQTPPIGSLVIGQNGLVIVANGGGGQKVMIDVASGATVDRLPRRCFWFSKWQIGVKDRDGVFQDVCSINL